MGVGSSARSFRLQFCWPAKLTLECSFPRITLPEFNYAGYDREETSPGIVKRVFEAGYAKRLASAEELLRPEDKNMMPNAKRLFDTIFPKDSTPIAVWIHGMDAGSSPA